MSSSLSINDIALAAVLFVFATCKFCCSIISSFFNIFFLTICSFLIFFVVVSRFGISKTVSFTLDIFILLIL